jgi:hypothetical protein
MRKLLIIAVIAAMVLSSVEARRPRFRFVPEESQRQNFDEEVHSEGRLLRRGDRFRNFLKNFKEKATEAFHKVHGLTTGRYNKSTINTPDRNSDENESEGRRLVIDVEKLTQKIKKAREQFIKLRNYIKNLRNKKQAENNEDSKTESEGRRLRKINIQRIKERIQELRAKIQNFVEKAKDIHGKAKDFVSQFKGGNSEEQQQPAETEGRRLIVVTAATVTKAVALIKKAKALRNKLRELRAQRKALKEKKDEEAKPVDEAPQTEGRRLRNGRFKQRWENLKARFNTFVQNHIRPAQQEAPAQEAAPAQDAAPAGEENGRRLWLSAEKRQRLRERFINLRNKVKEFIDRHSENKDLSPQVEEGRRLLLPLALAQVHFIGKKVKEFRDKRKNKGRKLFLNSLQQQFYTQLFKLRTHFESKRPEINEILVKVDNLFKDAPAQGTIAVVPQAEAPKVPSAAPAPTGRRLQMFVNLRTKIHSISQQLRTLLVSKQAEIKEIVAKVDNLFKVAPDQVQTGIALPPQAAPAAQGRLLRWRRRGGFR